MVLQARMPTRNPAGDDARSLATPPSTEVIEVVATRKGVAPVDLSECLHDVVDPDALDGLLTAPTSDADEPVTVGFTYCGYHVTINGDGRITLDEVDKAWRR